MIDEKILIVGDVHMTSFPPESRIDDYEDTVVKKLNQVFDIANSHKANRIIFMGDLFHSRSEQKDKYYSIYRLMDAFKYPHEAQVYALLGNHDLGMTNYDITNRPVGLLVNAECFSLLDESPIAYVQGDKTKVIITGENFNLKSEQGEIKTRKSLFPNKIDAEYRIHCVHQNIMPLSMANDNYVPQPAYIEDLFNESPNYDLLITGHIHVPDRRIVKHNNRTCLMAGSIMRVGLNEVELEPSVFLLHIVADKKVNVTIEEIKLKVEPTDKVFDLKKNLKRALDKSEMENFINALPDFESQGDKTLEKIMKFINDLEGDEITPQVKEHAINLVKQAMND